MWQFQGQVIDDLNRKELPVTLWHLKNNWFHYMLLISADYAGQIETTQKPFTVTN